MPVRFRHGVVPRRSSVPPHDRRLPREAGLGPDVSEVADFSSTTAGMYGRTSFSAEQRAFENLCAEIEKTLPTGFEGIVTAERTSYEWGNLFTSDDNSFSEAIVQARNLSASTNSPTLGQPHDPISSGYHLGTVRGSGKSGILGATDGTVQVRVPGSTQSTDVIVQGMEGSINEPKFENLPADARYDDRYSEQVGGTMVG